jgi:hypothetical protein
VVGAGLPQVRIGGLGGTSLGYCLLDRLRDLPVVGLRTITVISLI